ncbi:ECF RNA polymerase sigma factor SigK [Jatrophihabitans telluris]|uniref:ECF RNA polymerase sigma factor SigK n=1 Tax=Jatrophihabitans telluris TaxID=2038343 RepID=A0ABY4R1A8_9ACTN|nr:ECF RNA polymerase sigma factor SigK [Jatrophihabitans telluris]UQX89614.1 ECF RNA polymerase sigma factor SigK [Jatrophihabitans telluris]
MRRERSATTPLAAVPTPAEPTPLETLLAASARGEQQAFAELYDRTSSRVYGMVLRVVRDAAQSAEVTQDVYLEVWRQSARFDVTKSAVMPWLLMIAHRRAVDRVRAAQSSAARDNRYAELNTERPYDEVSEQVETSLEAQRVRRVMNDLTDVQRQAVSLAYFGGYSHSEVAELLHIPLGTVKTRIRDGLIRLRDALGVTA